MVADSSRTWPKPLIRQIEDDNSPYDTTLQVTTKLCYHCQSMFDAWDRWLEDPEYRFPHHQSVAELEKAAKTECSFCYQLWRDQIYITLSGPDAFDSDVWRTYRGQGISVKSCVRYDLKHATTLRHFELSLEFEETDETCDEDAISFRAILGPREYVSQWFDADENGEVTRSLASPSTAARPRAQTTTKSIDIAREWVQECWSSHEICKSRKSVYVPNRLVSTAPGRHHIRTKDDFQANPDYATLSHCWGSTTFLTLLRENLELFRRQIPADALSQTIQDAMATAYHVGLAWIWVDTLCILQNDEQDWQREAAAMASVYGSSSLNLSAAGAHNGHEGCFYPRPAHWVCQLDLDTDGTGANAVPKIAVPYSLYDRCLGSMPLLKRGWALQERLLAARTLHFAATELFWECHEVTCCESFPLRTPENIDKGVIRPTKWVRPSALWESVTASYSACKLTYPKDKFVAISGIAREVQKLNQDEYVAGMWRENMEAQLCWFSRKRSILQSTSEYIAPTWSWLAADVPVVGTLSEDHKTLLSIVDVSIELVGSDPFGAISSARLRLSCQALYRASYDITNNRLKVYAGQIRSAGTSLLDRPIDEADNSPKDLMAAPVFAFGHRGIEVRGLLLERVSNNKGVYQRIGIFSIPFEKTLDEPFQLEVIEENSLDDRDYIETIINESGRVCYVVDLV